MDRIIINELVKTNAISFGLDPFLIEALIIVESNFDEWAWNPEPRYRYLWDIRQNKPFRVLTPDEISSEKPPNDFHSLAGDPDQEWWGQQASWGLMQIMGAVAREHGFTGPYITKLLNPIENFQFGSIHLKSQFTWARGDAEQALAAWNGGRSGNQTRPFRNQFYADKVLKAKSQLEVRS